VRPARVVLRRPSVSAAKETPCVMAPIMVDDSRPRPTRDVGS
jgi:hypothetical protein